MKKKNIAFLIYSLDGGGAERVVANLINELHTKIDLHLVLMNDIIKYDIPNTIKIHYIDKSISTESNIFKIVKIPLLSWKYYRFCKKNNIFMSLSFMNRPNFINSFIKFWGYKGEVLLSEQVSTSSEYNKNTFKGKIGAFLIRHLYKHADLIIPCSKSIEYDLRKNFGLNQAKFFPIYNPVNLELIEEKLKLNDLKFDKFTFVSVARFSDQKNHIRVLEALAKAKNINCQLVLIGTGPLYEKIQKKATDLSILHKIIFTGFSDNPYKYIAAADCFILHSDYEGLPNVLLEALACGAAVISTDCPTGPREVLAPNSDLSILLKNELKIEEFGIMVPVGNSQLLSDAMVRIYEDVDLKENLKKLSKQRVKDFDLKYISELFQSLLTT